MIGFRRFGFSTLLVVLFAWSGLAQSLTIRSYAGPPSPVGGAQATTQVFGPPSAIVRMAREDLRRSETGCNNRGERI